MTWSTRALSELGTWHGGSTPSKAEPRYWADGTVPWLSPKDMGAEVLSGTRDHISSAAIEEGRARVVPAGSVALVVRSGILDRAVPVTIVPFATTLNQDMKALSPMPGVDARWVAWALRAQEHQILSEDRKSGTTVASLDSGKLFARRIPLPTLSVQRRTVDILENLLSRLDAADSYLAAARKRLERSSSAYSRAVLDSVAADFGKRPALEVLTIENGGTPAGLSDVLTASPDGRVPFFRVGDMNLSGGREMSSARTYVAEADARALGLKMREVGSVLIPKRGGAIATNKKRILATRGIYDMNTMGLRPRPGWIAEFVWHWLNGIDLGAIADGSNVPQINSRQIRDLRIPDAPVEVQRSIVARLDSYETSCKVAEVAVSMGLRRSTALRRTLIASAFSGQLAGTASERDRIEELADASHDLR